MVPSVEAASEKEEELHDPMQSSRKWLERGYEQVYEAKFLHHGGVQTLEQAS